MKLLEQTDFRQWYAGAVQIHTDDEGRVIMEHTEECEACGEAITEAAPPGEYCIICLAQRYASDLAERRIASAICGLADVISQGPEKFRPVMGQMVRDTLELLEDEGYENGIY